MDSVEKANQITMIVGGTLGVIFTGGLLMGIVYVFAYKTFKASKKTSLWISVAVGVMFAIGFFIALYALKRKQHDW